MDDKLNEAGEAIRVNIFDQIYSLRSPRGAEHIKRIAHVVDERMRQIAAHTTTFELSRIAVLAALNIADELEELKMREPSSMDSVPEESADKAAAATSAGESGEEESAGAQTWFEAIFDAEVPVKERSQRLSTQISNRLQTGRQETNRDAEEKK